MSTNLGVVPYHVPKYGEQVLQGTVTTWGLKSFQLTSNISAVSTDMREISVPVCGDPQGTLIPPCLPHLRCDNVGAGSKK